MTPKTQANLSSQSESRLFQLWTMIGKPMIWVFSLPCCVVYNVYCEEVVQSFYVLQLPVLLWVKHADSFEIGIYPLGAPLSSFLPT